MRDSLIFVSYRRDDSGPLALALRSELDLRLDGVPTFVDVNRIQGGDAFPEVLDDALSKSRIMLVLIGTKWIGERADGSIRIQDPGDWVNKEVARGLSHPSGAVMPILLEGATMPPSSQLPENLRKILSLQGVQLRTQSWDQDLRNLCETLSTRFGVHVKESSQFLPTPDELKSEVGKISDQGLARFKGDGRLPGWAVETVYDFKESGAVREFLKKTYRFKNDAVAFKFIAKIQSLTKKHKHHPIIEAKYADVSIRLSTWDAGHYITKYDVELAMALDKTAKPLRARSDVGRSG